MIDKIKSEIERLKDLNPEEIGIPKNLHWMVGKDFVCLALNAFIDKLAEELSSEDMQKAAEECANRRLEWADPQFANSSYSRRTKMGVQYFTGIDLEEAFIDGARWQRELMMKEAIAVPLYLDGDFLALDLDFSKMGYKVGDNVKIIIIKED